MAHYYLWTIGCQMNRADSERLAAYLDGMGYKPAASPEAADLVLLNSCVVRQSAEDRVTHQLDCLKAVKEANPKVAIGLTGCLVDSNAAELKQRFPHVDVFFGPQALGNLEEWLSTRGALPEREAPVLAVRFPTAFVPVIQGCDSFCTYCIVPFRRGREKSRPIADIACEVRELVRRGVKEVTLLGQKVDAYGHDLPEKPDLADLLTELNGIDGLVRLRFLTSHPNHMSGRIIEAVASLDKACEHINLPVQAGDDEVLKAMRRGYRVGDYRKLIDRIRSVIPGVALTTDVIVGFPGESDEQFRHTLDLVKEIRFDAVHVAAYSRRPGTWATRHLKDAVRSPIKRDRKRLVEAAQAEIAQGINTRLVGQAVEVLVEGKEKGRWQGRTRTDKLVFFSDPVDRAGQLAQVKIDRAGPWWLEGLAQR
ncbi:MAG: tRNA (N6-isopentenyl adenosine(37)-C2)-methylthiotransferase MiaB [Chloroflexi bacterium]|nr:tRNA (N6-isopentenyl adenosine(37)-C2)-methylthiotransferase MiaB [Chloroflexota bacterium]